MHKLQHRHVPDSRWYLFTIGRDFYLKVEVAGKVESIPQVHPIQVGWNLSERFKYYLSKIMASGHC